nr:flagellar biosynthetic protein FliQ [Erwinia amylovora]
MNNTLFKSNDALVVVLKQTAVHDEFDNLLGFVGGHFQKILKIHEQTIPFCLKMNALFASISMLSQWYSTHI